MSRPFVKYPVNHHLAQLLERGLVSGAIGGRTLVSSKARHSMATNLNHHTTFQTGIASATHGPPDSRPSQRGLEVQGSLLESNLPNMQRVEVSITER